MGSGYKASKYYSSSIVKTAISFLFNLSKALIANKAGISSSCISWICRLPDNVVIKENGIGVVDSVYLMK